MDEESGIDEIQDVVSRLVIFLGRPVVLQQILALILIIGAAMVARRLIWRALERSPRVRRALEVVPGATGSRRRIRIALTLARAFTFPIVGLVLARLVEQAMTSAGLLTGLLHQISRIFILFLVVRFIVKTY